MSEYTAQVAWQRADDEAFTDQRYSRRHTLRFDGGAELVGSASPSVVRVPYSDPAGVDPEELFVASLSSCHMLWFLSIAAQQGLRIDRYTDEASGVMAPNGDGKMVMRLVTLRPQVLFGGSPPPDTEALLALHHQAHEECFIANSVHTEVRVEPRP